MTAKPILSSLLALAFAAGPTFAMQHESGADATAQAVPEACGTAVADAPAPEGSASSGAGHGGGHMADAGATAEGSPAWPALMAAMADMDTTMPSESSGDADEDFVRMMIPHHRSAVDMAEAVLANGADTRIRALAEEVIASQAQEIATMCAWLEERG